MTRIAVSIVDIYPVRLVDGRLETLLLRRSAGARCTGSWESVHGHIEAGELPVMAAVRELEEETGLVPLRLYNLSRVESFYQHRIDEVALVPVFAALVDPAAQVVLSREHDRFEWAALAPAAGKFAWPRERRAVADLEQLLGGGDAGNLEDVLRIK